MSTKDKTIYLDFDEKLLESLDLMIYKQNYELTNIISDEEKIDLNTLHDIVYSGDDFKIPLKDKKKDKNKG